MWLLIAREPAPDVPYWPGRRLLAAVDAAVWPLFWVLLFSHAPKPVGLVGPFVAAVALLSALGRLHRALWMNHRYRRQQRDRRNERTDQADGLWRVADRKSVV